MILGTLQPIGFAACTQFASGQSHFVFHFGKEMGRGRENIEAGGRREGEISSWFFHCSVQFCSNFSILLAAALLSKTKQNKYLHTSARGSLLITGSQFCFVLFSPFHSEMAPLCSWCAITAMNEVMGGGVLQPFFFNLVLLGYIRAAAPRFQNAGPEILRITIYSQHIQRIPDRFRVIHWRPEHHPIPEHSPNMYNSPPLSVLPVITHHQFLHIPRRPWLLWLFHFFGECVFFLFFILLIVFTPLNYWFVFTARAGTRQMVLCLRINLVWHSKYLGLKW